MLPSETELVATFRELGNEALLRRLRAGTLTPLARMLAIEELGSRGLRWPEVREPPAPALAGHGPLATLAQFHEPVEAQLLQGRLLAEGIPALLADEHLVQANRLLAIAIGGVRVQVPEDCLARAQAIVAALAAGDYALDEDADVGPPE